MNGWLWGASVLVCTLLPLLWICTRLPAPEGIVAIEAAGVDAALALLLISEGTGRQPFADLALVLAVVSFIGGLAYLRFVEAFRD
jgi:multisubunit Na+/H+ antiporter MnhF subunit